MSLSQMAEEPAPGCRLVHRGVIVALGAELRSIYQRALKLR
jgi:hypothetical protein